MTNGTVTMEVALKALGIGWGDEVIVPALTFSATAYAPIAAGALPVFVDVTPETWTIDPDAVEAAITPTDAGDHARAPRASDGRHGPDHGDRRGARPRRRRGLRPRARPAVERTSGAGCIGDFGSFSHQSSKILTAGEGGSLLTNDDRLARLAHSIIDCGRPKDDDEKEYTFGANYRLGELHAALLEVAMDRFPDAAGGARRRSATVRSQELAADDPRRPGDAARRAHHAVELLSVHPRDRPRRVRRPDARRGAATRSRPRAIGAWTGYEPMSRLRPVPAVALAAAGRRWSTPIGSTPPRMSFPVAEAAGLRESVYLDENVFRSDRTGVEQAVEALAKIQRARGRAAARR